jgi:hypothetical protein
MLVQEVDFIPGLVVASTLEQEVDSPLVQEAGSMWGRVAACMLGHAIIHIRATYHRGMSSFRSSESMD